MTDIQSTVGHDGPRSSMWIRSSLNTSRILRFMLIVESIVLLGSALSIRRDYQDSWILEGLEVPFILIVGTYLIYISIEDKVERILPYALMSRAIFFLIPSLKYSWFQGLAMDQQLAFGLMQDIYNQGHIRTDNLFTSTFEYSGTPLTHLTLAEYSRVTAINPLYTFTFLLFAIWMMYPVLTLVLARRILPIDKNRSIEKYVLLLACIPYTSQIAYIFTGSTMGLLLVFLFLSQFAQALHLNDRRFWIVALVSALTLIASHSFSSSTLLIGLLITYLIYRVFKGRVAFNLSYLSAKFLVMLAILNLAWLWFMAHNMLQQAVSVVSIFINSVFGSTDSVPSITGIFPRFFDLGSLDQLKMILLNFGAYIFLLPLMLGGIVIVLVKYRHSKPLMFISLYALSLWMFQGAQMLMSQLKAGFLGYDRIPVHTLLLSPIFIGLLLSQTHVASRRTRAGAIVISIVMVLSVVKAFDPPQLIPSADSVVIGLPSNIPIVYVNDVNSIYQRSMIKFAEGHIVNGMIACDDWTRLQISGMADYTFFNGHVLYFSYPFNRLIDENYPKDEFDYFLTHTPGKSGGFVEKAEIRTPALITESIQNSSVIYTNGESYVTTKPFAGSPWDTIL